MHSRREMFGSLAGLAAVCVSAQAVKAQKADPMAGMGNRAMTKQECAETCHKSQVTCHVSADSEVLLGAGWQSHLAFTYRAAARLR